MGTLEGGRDAYTVKPVQKQHDAERPNALGDSLTCAERQAAPEGLES